MAVAVNLTVILPVLYVSVIFIRIAIPCSVMQTVLLFVIPTVYAFFISVLGIYLNIKFPNGRFDLMGYVGNHALQVSLLLLNSLLVAAQHLIQTA